MRSMSDTISRLKALGSNVNSRPKKPARGRLVPLADFGSNPGNLDSYVYVPTNKVRNPPLVVVLHGCTQSADEYDAGSGWSELADHDGFVLLYPEQQSSNNPNRCFNWFSKDDSSRGKGEALSIAQMISRVVADHGINPSRIFITGLSAGGAMTTAMLAAYPELFCGGAIIAGLPAGSASSIPQAFDRMRGHGGPSDRALVELIKEASSHDGPWPKISVWHGTGDSIVAYSNMRDILKQWLGIHRLPAKPDAMTVVNGYQRQVWTGPNNTELVEAYTIPGMGHGTPVQAGGADALGTAGPYFLNVGISSSRQIALFWEISSERVPSTETDNAFQPPSGEPVAPPPPDTSTGIQKTIEDALRKAGLMR